MKLGQRDRRALALLGVAILVVVATEFAMRERGELPATPAAADSVPVAQRRLMKVRQVASTLPAREQALKVATEDLARREKGIVRGETLAQAQAQLMQTVRQLAAAQSPPIDVRGVEVGQARLLGDDYGEILVTMSFECRIEQLVNLIAEISAQPDLIALNGLRVTAGNVKEKTINARLTLGGVVPRKFVPEKKGGRL
jgi:hypothetical protein